MAEVVMVPFVGGGVAPDYERYVLPVTYVASDFARGPDGTCAFCEGDPCAERPGAPERIKKYMASQWAETCPFCEGRPT